MILTNNEIKIIRNFSILFPDGDTDDFIEKLKITREQVSYAMQHLIQMEFVDASIHDGENPFAPYYRNATLTYKGEQLRRDLLRCWIIRFLEKEWKWLVSTLIGLVALILSLWNFFTS